jgi:aminoglycoside phosphotransferase (APT) family kinase protein
VEETPRAEWPIDAALVRALLREQHPDLAHLDVAPLSAGWDNAMFRLGADLVARIPRRRSAVPLIENEQRWLPSLSSALPLPIPAPLRVGVPGARHPSPWSVVPWLGGAPADEQPLEADESDRLAGFLLGLHRPAPAEAPRNPARGVALSQREAALGERLGRLAEKTALITPPIQAAWRAALASPAAPRDTWLHGDLHARNVLVESGRLSAVIDWGDVCQGDPATDLASVWMLLPDARSRDRALSVYEPDEALRLRARGWAVLFGAVLLDTGLVDHPRHATMGERTLRAVASGP